MKRSTLEMKMFDIQEDKTGSSTLSKKVVRGLADDIVSGRLPSGCKLEEQAIAERFGISRSPVRDALRELAIIGLVEIVPRRGAMVLRVDVARLRDMYETSSEIEALCAKFAAERMTRSERLNLQAIGRQCHEAAQAGDGVAFAQLNEKLHEAIFDGARNMSLAELARSFRIRLSPFRAQFFYNKEQRMTASDEEHNRIVAAIVAGDAAAASSAVGEHISNASINVVDFFESGR